MGKPQTFRRESYASYPSPGVRDQALVRVPLEITLLGELDLLAGPLHLMPPHAPGLLCPRHQLLLDRSVHGEGLSASTRLACQPRRHPDVV